MLKKGQLTSLLFCTKNTKIKFLKKVLKKYWQSELKVVKYKKSQRGNDKKVHWKVNNKQTFEKTKR